MMQKFRKLSLESQLFFSFMAVSVCLLLLSLSITLSSTITRQRQEIDKNISALAAYVASMDSVVSMLENGYPDGSANEELDSLSENFSDLNVMAIYRPGCGSTTQTGRRRGKPSSAARRRQS